MIDHSHDTATEAQSADILPWADPYIMQLFSEAELLETAEEAKPSPRRDRPVLSPGRKATGVAEFRRSSWTIRPLRRSVAPRMRRTAAEHLMARC
jgi:hypothetical protein